MQAFTRLNICYCLCPHRGPPWTGISERLCSMLDLTFRESLSREVRRTHLLSTWVNKGMLLA
jgi:hypothetical protein